MSVETLERILAEHPFFRGLPEAHLDTVVGCVKNVTFDAGAFLFRAGEPADQFFVIRHGKVSVEMFVPGRGAMTIDTVGEGELLGFSWLVPPYRSHFENRALSFVRALALDGTCLRGKCEAHPDLGYALLKRVSQTMMERLEAMQVQLLDIYGQQP